jgi:hypothetical protein
MKKVEAHTDHGTVLKPDQAALAFDPDGDMAALVRTCRRMRRFRRAGG